jgi:hypothetical protein
MKIPSIKKPTITINKKLRKLALLLVAGLVLFGVGALSLRHYENNKVKKPTVEEVTAAKDAEIAQVKADSQAKVDRVLEQYTKSRLECEKGLGYYARLTAFQRSLVQAPVSCGPAIIN